MAGAAPSTIQPGRTVPTCRPGTKLQAHSRVCGQEPGAKRLADLTDRDAVEAWPAACPASQCVAARPQDGQLRPVAQSSRLQDQWAATHTAAAATAGLQTNRRSRSSRLCSAQHTAKCTLPAGRGSRDLLRHRWVLPSCSFMSCMPHTPIGKVPGGRASGTQPLPRSGARGPPAVLRTGLYRVGPLSADAKAARPPSRPVLSRGRLTAPDPRKHDTSWR